MTHPELPHACSDMVIQITDEAVPLVYDPRFREYALVVGDSEVRQMLFFCPWCGTELPASLRHTFFDEMDRLGVDFPAEAPPQQYASDAWWRARLVP